MGLAEYMIVSKPEGWTILHDGTAQHDYDTKEAAFEAAVAAASLAPRQGPEVHPSAPGRAAGNKPAPGASDSKSVPRYALVPRALGTIRPQTSSGAARTAVAISGVWRFQDFGLRIE